MTLEEMFEEETPFGTKLGNYLSINENGGIDFDYDFALEDIWDFDESDEGLALGTLHRVYLLENFRKDKKDELSRLVCEYVMTPPRCAHPSHAGQIAIKRAKCLSYYLNDGKTCKRNERPFDEYCHDLIHAVGMRHLEPMLAAAC